MQKTLLAVALVLGGLVACVDSRPGWDDTGLTAAVLLLVSGVLGFVSPRRPWLWALAVGAWIPLLGIAGAHNYGALLALVFAFAGAYIGMALHAFALPARA